MARRVLARPRFDPNDTRPPSLRSEAWCLGLICETRSDKGAPWQKSMFDIDLRSSVGQFYMLVLHEMICHGGLFST